jgi:hypothetical protein
MKRIVAAVMVAFVSVSVWAETPTGFRELKWGSSPPRSLKKFADNGGGLTMYTPATGKAPAPLFGIPVAEEAYSFSKLRFYSGSAWLDGRENFEKAKEALTKLYGPPTFSNQASELFKWQWPSTKVEVQLYYQAKFSRTTITFENNAI